MYIYISYVLVNSFHETQNKDAHYLCYGLDIRRMVTALSRFLPNILQNITSSLNLIYTHDIICKSNFPAMQKSNELITQMRIGA